MNRLIFLSFSLLMMPVVHAMQAPERPESPQGRPNTSALTQISAEEIHTAAERAQFLNDRVCDYESLPATPLKLDGLRALQGQINCFYATVGPVSVKVQRQVARLQCDIQIEIEKTEKVLRDLFGPAIN